MGATDITTPFDLPEQGGGQTYEVNEDIVEGRKEMFPIPRNKSA